MSKASLFKSQNYAPSSPRNAFGIGYSTLFSSPAGLMLPAYVEDVKAKDTVELSLSSITRTRPVNTAAFMSFDEKIDFWYVPYRLIWSDYNNWRLSQSIRRNTFANIDSGLIETVPLTSWKSLSLFIEQVNNYDVDLYAGYLIDSSCSFFLRQMDLLGYGIPPIGDLLLNTTDNSFGIFRPQSSDSSTYDSSSGTGNGQSPNTPHALSSSGTRPGRPSSGRPNAGSGSSGIGNVRPGGDSSAEAENTSFCTILQSYYNNYDKTLGSPLNYFRLAAYQCIYQHAYRNEEFEQLDPSYYNVDNLFFDSSVGSSSNVQGKDPSLVSSSVANLAYGSISEASDAYYQLTLWKLFTPRFKNWRKDVFTDIKPTDLKSVNGISVPTAIPGYGSTGSSFQSAGDVDGDSKPVANLNTIADSDVYFDYLSKANAYFPYINVNDLGGKLLANNIRLLMAQDKFTRRSLYADQNFKSQMKAMFGVDVDEPDVPRYLGSHSSNISINEVVATSAGEASFGSDDSSTSVLGEVAGKGFQSSNGHVFKSTFNEDGIIMGIHYIMPRNNYNSYRINKFNTKLSRWDYYYPDFDGLGLSPVFARELSLAQFDADDPVTSPTTNIYNTHILGYAPRYYEYKERQNEVHGIFMSGQSESNWTLTNNKEYVWSGDDARLWKILPTVTDPIFTMAYDGSQSTDPFMCYYDFNVSRVSNMEIIGTPSV